MDFTKASADVQVAGCKVEGVLVGVSGFALLASTVVTPIILKMKRKI